MKSNAAFVDSLMFWFVELVVELIECLQSNSLNQIKLTNQTLIGINLPQLAAATFVSMPV